jgi:exodeoxyribonuclease V alpha subunit
VFRQAAQSRIIINAHRISQGSMPDLGPPGTDDPETAVSRIVELVKTRIPKRFRLDAIRDLQVPVIDAQAAGEALLASARKYWGR